MTVKCPHCGDSIDHLIHYEMHDYLADVELVDGKLTPLNEQSTISVVRYTCPVCSGLVCESEEDAIKFLGGEK